MKKLIAILLCLAMLLSLSACEDEATPPEEPTIATGEKGDKGDQGEKGDKGDQGVPGEAGIGIEKTEIINGELIITYTDGTSVNVGWSVGDVGVTNENPQGLAFYLLYDGTYGVMAGNALLREEITIPASYRGNEVTQILPNAFVNTNLSLVATNLKKVVIPDSVTKISEYAFYGCSRLESVTIPDSVEIIDSYAFSGCSSLKSVMIPDSVKTIGSAAFEGCSSLKSIVIPDSVEYIKYATFSDCSSLTSIVIPDSVRSIGYDAFSGCNSLASITIPDRVRSIGNYAFSGCGSLESITIPDYVTSIGFSAFSGCSGLTSIMIPDYVTSIGDEAFSGCNRLASVYYNGTESEWDEISIGHSNDSLTSATIYYHSYSTPISAGNYWRYVGGVPTPWENQ